MYIFLGQDNIGWHKKNMSFDKIFIHIRNTYVSYLRLKFKLSSKVIPYIHCKEYDNLVIDEHTFGLTF